MLGSRWINVSRIEDMLIGDNAVAIKLMGCEPIDLKCNSDELTDLLDHGYEDK